MVAYVTKKRDTRHQRNGLCLDEDEARFFFKQLIWAVGFCHKHHVAHRLGAARCSSHLDHISPLCAVILITSHHFVQSS